MSETEMLKQELEDVKESNKDLIEALAGPKGIRAWLQKNWPYALWVIAAAQVLQVVL